MERLNTDRQQNTLRVVVADDNMDMRLAIEGLLQGPFDVVGSVSNGAALVEVALACHPDVIVSDVSMPLQSGVEALRVLRNRGAHVPFVLVSFDTNCVQQWIELGATCVVHKMDLASELECAVRAAADAAVYISRTANRR